MSPVKTERDARIDFFRGLFLVMMCIDHFDFLSVLLGSQAKAKMYTYHSLGWSTAAEFFVFFSGYVLATVYAKTLACAGPHLTQVRALHRSWELYARNALIWVLAVGMVGLLFGSNADLVRATQIDRAQAYADGGITAFMSLQYAPIYFEILPLYIVLILLAPGYLWLHGRARFAGIALSAALWLAVQWHPSLNFQAAKGPWNFNPFAWQFVFFIGMWLAREYPLTRFGEHHRRTKLTAAVTVFMLFLALKVVDRAGWSLPLIGVVDVPGKVKPNIELIPLLHFLTVVCIVGLAMPSNEWVQRHWLQRSVAQVGKHSLDAFCLSILLVYVTGGVFSLTSRGTAEYFVLVLVNALAMVASGYWFSWLKSQPWKVVRRRVEPAAAGAACGSDNAQLVQTGRSTQ